MLMNGKNSYRYIIVRKLAVSYGLLNTTNSTPLHLVQSHRICDDCHLAVKLMTKATGRVIVVRDASRFHRFEDGKCSCVSISCVTFSPNKQPLANIAIHKDVIDNQESAHIIIQPEDVLWVTVGMVSAEPSEGDWVGVFSSAKFKGPTFTPSAPHLANCNPRSAPPSRCTPVYRFEVPPPCGPSAPSQHTR
ncbi:hypothetical protein E3N88_21151 [Mikania micrantha]|uniref:DYW domain-containing protein n=1 Tax=Mikania micrantha TaxID=192012 RepID=A0A5N6NLU4_9ASTR|nr:hypothetical protein E3N88_21151 [Mikania micrantha]